MHFNASFDRARARVAQVIQEGSRHATALARSSNAHGERHWRDVAHMGLRQVQLGLSADAEVLMLFAALHDTQRWDDYEDPQHGPRAAVLAEQLRQQRVLDLEPERFELLHVALTEHNGAPGHENLTIGCALDADRYTLWRVGIEPELCWISAAREKWLLSAQLEELKAYGERLVEGPGFSWVQLMNQWESLPR